MLLANYFVILSFSPQSQAEPRIGRLEALPPDYPSLLWRQSLPHQFHRQSLGTRNTPSPPLPLPRLLPAVYTQVGVGVISAP